MKDIDISGLNLTKETNIPDIDISDLNLTKDNDIPDIDISDLNLEKANPLNTAVSMFTSPLKKLADITTIENKPQNIEPSLRAMTPQEQTRKQTPEEQQINAEVEQRARDMQFERLGDKINLTSAGLDTAEQLDKLKKKQQYAVMSAELPVLAMTGGIPLAVAGGIEGIKQAKNLIVQTSKGEKYNPLDIRMLSELLPQNTPEYARFISSLAEMGTDVAVLGVGANIGRKFAIRNSVDTIKNKMSKAGYDQPTIDKVSSKLEQSIVERELGINPKNVIGEQPPPIDIDEAIKMNIQARTAKIPPAVKTEPINVTPKTEPIMTKEVIQKQNPIKMTEEEYLSMQNAEFMRGARLDIHKNRDKTKFGQIKLVNNVSDEMAENNIRRELLRQEYKDKVKNGEIIKPSSFEKLIKTANGNPDNEAVIASRELLKKKGIDWQNPIHPTPNIETPAVDVKTIAKEDFGSISPTSDGRFVAYDTVRQERLYIKGNGTNIQYFNTESEARKALDKVYENNYSKPIKNNQNLGVAEPTNEDLASVSRTQIPTIGALPTESIKETDFKLYQRSLDLANKYKSGKIAESKYRPKKTLGVYYNNTKGKGNIYLKSLNNIEVVSHELVHDIDAQNGLITNLMIDNSPTSTQIKSELRKSYNDNYGLISKSHSKERKLQEGLAMVIQLSAVNPEYVAKNYPKALEFAMNNKILKEFRDESRQIIIDYEGLSAVDKIKSMGYVKDNKNKKISKIPLKTKLDTQFFDSEAPLDLLKVGNELHSDIYLTAKGSRTILNGVIKNNLTNKDGSFYVLDSDGLPTKVYNENFYTLGVKIDNTNSDFREYLKARRFYSMLKQRNIYPSLSKEYTELNSILKKNSLSDETIKNAYKTLDTQVNRDLATEYDKLIKFNLDTLLNSRLIKQDFYQEMLDNKGYTPLNRVQYNELVGDDITDLGNFTSMSSKNLKQMTGSDLPIIDPYLSTINLMIQTNKKAYRQIFNNKFLNVIDEYSDLMQRVPYRQGMENDKTILMAKDSDGTYAPIQMNAYIKETVDKLFEIVKPNIIEQILLFPTQFFTKMTTGKYPVFALTNLSIDQVTAFVNSKNGYLPFYTGIETFIKILKDPQLKKYTDEYSDLFGIDNNTLLGTLEMENYNFKKASNKFNPIKMFDKYLTLPANLSETFSRETEYIQARLNGRTVQEAKRMADEITGPFVDKGRWFGRIGQVLIKSIPFFNPTLQISRQTLRSLGNKGNRSKFFLTLLLATLLKVQGDRTILDSEDEEDRRVHMQLMAEQIAMYLYYSKKGNGLYKIKIDQAYLFVGALATMIYNSTKNGYDYNIADYVNAGTSFIPDQVNIFNAITDLIANKDYSGFEKMGLTSMPHLAKIFTSMMFGKKTFPTVMNIVPQSLSRKEPYLQYNERTSDVAKYLGKTLNLSPMKIDDFVDNVLGRASRLGIRSTETLLRSVQGKENKYNLKALSGMNPFWQQTYPSSGRFTKKAYDIKNQLAQFKDTSKNNRDEMTPEKRQFVNKNKGLLLRFNLATKLYNKLNKGIRDGKIKDDTQTQIRKLKLEKQLFEIEQKLANKN